MRHIYIRCFLALIWLAAAIASAIYGSFELMALYIVICGIFLYTIYVMWKKEKNNGGGK